MTNLDKYLNNPVESKEYDPVYNYTQEDTTFEETSATDIIQQEMQLLPHQLELMSNTTSKVLGLVSGYGGGKTYSAVRKHLHLMSLNPGSDSIFLEPTYSLLIQILYPEMNDALDEAGYEWRLAKSEGIYYVQVNGLTTRIITKSFESWEKIIGVNASHCTLDEFDVVKADIGYKAFIKLLGRLRAGNIRQMIIVSTPESFGAMYRIFVKEKQGHLIRAKTTDNIFLPADFIQTLYDTYPPNLVAAYVNGEFVNLNGTNVFSDFDRKTCSVKVKLTNNDTEIWMGSDFNSGGAANIFAIRQDGNVYIYGEKLTKNTFETRDYIKDTYRGCSIYGCCDATGSKTTTNSSQSDLDILEEAGVSLMQGRANPHIQDSILAVNNSFRTGKLFIDVDSCPRLTEAVEQLSYDGITGKPEKRAGAGTIDDWTDALRYLMWVINPVTKLTFSTYSGLGRVKR